MAHADQRRRAFDCFRRVGFARVDLRVAVFAPFFLVRVVACFLREDFFAAGRATFFFTVFAAVRARFAAFFATFFAPLATFFAAFATFFTVFVAAFFALVAAGVVAATEALT